MLDASQGLDYGQDYTFTFKLSAWGNPVSLDDIMQALGQLQDLGGVTVQESTTGAVGLTLAGGLWDVTFTFQGDDTTATVGSVAQEISNVVGSIHWFTSFNFVQADTGQETGLVGTGAADQGLSSVEHLTGDISKSILYIAIGLVLLVVALKFL